MAAPSHATAANTTGKYILNRTLSTPHDDVLAAQGVTWLNRTLISIATVTLELQHTYLLDPKIETIKFQNTATGGIKGTSGEYYFPCSAKKHYDHVFGHVLIDAIRKPLTEIDHDCLKTGWTADVETTPYDDVKGVLWTFTFPDLEKREDRWSAEQVWGYAEHDIPGAGRQKRYTRKIHFVSPNLTKDVVLIYDQVDPPPQSSTSSSEPTSNTTDSEATLEDDLGNYGSSV